MEQHIKTTGEMRATLSAVKIHGPNSQTPGRVEDLGIIASTEDGTLSPSLLDQLKQAWREGWDEGMKKDGE